MFDTRQIAVFLATTAALSLSAFVTLAQTPPSAPRSTPPASTQPTTQQAAYDRLLGGDGDRPEKPILPTGTPTVDATSGGASVAPGAPQVQLRREGLYIVNQTGRLAKSSDGQGFEFVFDADRSALQDPPMKVLPNLRLGKMEEEIQAIGRDLQFRVTGMVTEYRGRNHILLEKVVVVQPVK
jgi:hypothetical protein